MDLYFSLDVCVLSEVTSLLTLEPRYLIVFSFPWRPCIFASVWFHFLNFFLKNCFSVTTTILLVSLLRCKNYYMLLNRKVAQLLNREVSAENTYRAGCVYSAYSISKFPFKKTLRARQMTVFQKTQVAFFTPVPRYATLSFDLFRHNTHMVCKHMCRQNTHTRK